MSLLKIYNGIIITPDHVIPGGTLIVQNGVISEISAGDIETGDAHTIDAAGRYIGPGFIDIHVHGGGGFDFMDGTPEAFLKIAETHAQFGTTALMPTTLSCDNDELIATLEAYKKADTSNSGGAQFIGMHIEGPYFAMNQRGAQDPRFIRDPDPAEYEDIVNRYDIIKRWSAAPERKGALQFARFLKSKGILPALAHTDAVYDEVLEGFDNGYILATHLYSGMSSVTRRNAYRFAGVVESAFLIDDMYVEVIADGCHLPEPLLKLIYKIKGADRIALITDAMRGAGMPEGESLLGSKRNGLKVIIEEGVAKLPDRTSFAGSVATADRLLRTMITLAGVSIRDAIRMITFTPAVILGIQDKKGSLEEGKDADIVIFDEQVNVFTTIVQGNVVFSKPFISGNQQNKHERPANIV